MKKSTYLAFAALATYSGLAASIGTFIPATNRVDMVHDADRGVIYISAANSVLRYDMGTATFLSPIAIGGSLAGLDLSPDGEWLVVADKSSSSTHVWVHLVNLNDLSYSQISTTKNDNYESGTFTASYLADGSFSTTSQFSGSGLVPMRIFDPALGTWHTLASVTLNTMLSVSGDAKTLVFAEADTSSGDWGRYDVELQALDRRTGYTNGTSSFNYEIASNAHGTQYAIPTYRGTMVYDQSFTKIATLGQYAGSQPIGVAYHPVENLAYFPWTTTTEVREYDMDSLTPIASYDFEDSFQSNGNNAFVQGRTKLSRDGSLLMVTVTGGVRVHELYAPLSATNVNGTTIESTPVSVELSGSIGNNGQLAYTISQAPAHGTVVVNGATATYTPAANFTGTDSFHYQVGYGLAIEEASVSIVVQPSNHAPLANHDSHTMKRNYTATIDALANDSDPDNDMLTIIAVTIPNNATASIKANKIKFIPKRNFVGTSSFTYTIRDTKGATASAIVNVQVVK